MIEDALDISRLENNKFQIFKELFDLRLLVKEVTEILGFQIEEKGLKLELTIHKSVPGRVYSDPKRLKQVLFNLLGNAIKFTFKGKVSLCLQFDVLNQLTMTIEDTGIGMQKEDLSKLFKFFGCLTKTKDINRGGMGLGLTISKMII